MESPYGMCCVVPSRCRVRADKEARRERTHGIVGREEIDEFTHGERDGHGDGGRDEEETYGEKERLSLGFGEGDDFAEGRAGVGRRPEGLWEDAGEKRAVDGRREGGERTGERDGPGRSKAGGAGRTENESRGQRPQQHRGRSLNMYPRDYFLRTIRDNTPLSSVATTGFANTSWKSDRYSVQRVTTSTTLFSSHRTIILSLCHTPVVHTDNGPRIRFAITTSVNIRSPTITNSSSLIGSRSVEKYPRIDLMHEYAGLGALCRSTGTER